jgi:hypothetical protein
MSVIATMAPGAVIVVLTMSFSIIAELLKFSDN